MEVVSATVPGRVNLLGEHIDYHGGTVLPAALRVALTVDLMPRGDDRISISARGYPGSAERRLGEPAIGHWSDPSAGALAEAAALGWLAGGAALSIRSTIPPGSGLSSSAALIVAILKAARSHAGAAMSDLELARAARRVENDYLGLPCGIMDQVAVALGRPGEALVLDTLTLDHRRMPLPPDHAMAVLHSGQSRKLGDGRYSQRKEECDAAARAFGVDQLCALDVGAVECADAIDRVLRRRARHCASEQARVLAAITALEARDMARFGALMVEGHASLRDDFEVSTPAVDALVADAVALGARGARLTGGGFGGCIVACVEAGRREAWLAELLARHPRARFIDAVTGEG